MTTKIITVINNFIENTEWFEYNKENGDGFWVRKARKL